MPAPRVSVVIADDHPLFREAVERAVEPGRQPGVFAQIRRGSLEPVVHDPAHPAAARALPVL